jgi:hypothetical protein
MKHRLAFLGLITILVVSASNASAAGTQQDAAALEQFRARVEEYAKLHRSLEEKIPRVSKDATPEQISAHKKALADAIQQARSNANPGDVIGNAEQSLRQLITDELKGRQGAEARAMARDGNPANEPIGKPLVLSVNAPYPPEAPVSSVPPTLLLRLPPLPEELNYRFIGRHLILLDTHADVIADFILNATP